MYTKLLLFLAAVVTLAAAKVPSYMPVCGRRNPKLGECVVNSVTILRDKLRKGIPELEVPPVDPISIPRAQLADMPDFKAYGTDIKLYGILSYHVNTFHVDLEKQQMNLDANFDECKLTASYNVSAKILVPINGKGPIILTTKNPNIKATLNYKLIDRNNEKYMYFSSMKTRLNIGSYNVTFHADNFDQTLQDAVSQAVENSQQEVLDATRPNLEKAISETVLNLGNKIFKHFTYDELFPDRE